MPGAISRHPAPFRALARGDHGASPATPMGGLIARASTEQGVGRMSMTRRHTGGPAATSAARTITRLAAGLTLLVAAPAGAQMMNTTLTFENVPGSAPAGGVRRVNNCLVESGIRITVLEQAGNSANSALQALPCETGTPTPSTPTALAMYAPGNGSFLGNAIFNDVGSALEFTPVAGGPFSLLSLDLASYDLTVGGTMPVTFTGFRVGGGMNATQLGTLMLSTPAFTTFTLTGFTDLSSARVTFGSPLFGAQVDNVRIATTAVIPEPSTYVLLATGLAALGGVARRRRTTATR